MATLAMGLVLSSLGAAPAKAHVQKGLSVKVESAWLECDEVRYPFCLIAGTVRVTNKRPRNSGKIVICVGIDVHTEGHRNISYEPPTPSGQAVVTLRPGRSQTVSFTSHFDARGGAPHHLAVTHVHKHIYHPGGDQC